MALLLLEDVHKVYPTGQAAVQGVSLEVGDGELVVLVGPSGCGKSTVLRLVAGLEVPTRGRIRLGDRDVTGLAPQERDVAMVFQSYALYPHMTVRENLAFGLRMRGVPSRTRDERVAVAARMLGLTEVLDRKPAQLSGGQRQRVALGRAIVREPQAFLLDEPLSNLDARLRVETRTELARLHRHTGATMLYVTHDQEEAMTLGQQVAVMNAGLIEQVAPPLEIYRRPANPFVAGFMGSPAMNLLPGAAGSEDGVTMIRSPHLALPMESVTAAGGVILGIRPQDIDLVGPGEGDLDALVEVLEPLGSALLVHAVSHGREAGREAERLELRILAPPDARVGVEQRVGLRFRRDRLHLFEATAGRRLN